MSLVVSRAQYCRQYNNQFRATFTIKGEAHQFYLDDQIEAQTLQYLMRKASRSELLPLTFQTVKKRNAGNSKGLPVGVSVCLPSAKHRNPALMYHYRDPRTKKPVGISVGYGEDMRLANGVRGSRTQAEALAILIERVHEIAKRHSIEMGI